MCFKIISTLVVLLCCVSPQNSEDRGWRGIIPLHSTRAEVLEKLGPPHGAGEGGYIFEDVSLSFVYSSKPCAGGWSVPVGTVLWFTVGIRKDRPKISELNLDLSQYEKRKDGHQPNITYYQNKKQGVTYVVYPDGEVTSIDYGPSEDDEKLKCEIPPPELSLKLSTSIIEQRYCNWGEDDYDSLYMKLRLKYTNVGSHPLILYKDGFIEQELISNTAEDAAAGQLRASSYAPISGERHEVDNALLDQVFTILPPGGSYEAGEAKVSIYAAHSSQGEAAGYLKPGDYVLQVRVSLWPKTQTSREALHEQWQERGYLWSNDVISTPMAFKVEKEREVIRCSP
jgi:hypothetical protein